MSQPKMNVTGWQDYRGKSEGILLYLNAPKTQALPVRDVLDELGKGFELDPNYETQSFNFFACKHSKALTSIIKNRRRYMFLSTCYEGTIKELQGKFLIFGFYRIDKTTDVRKRHVHQYMANPELCPAPECIDLTECYAAYSDDMRLFHPTDAFELSESIMKSWGYKGRVAKHMKLTFSPEQVEQVLAHFNARTPITQEYLDLIKDLESKKEQVIVDRAEAKKKEEEMW